MTLDVEKVIGSKSAAFAAAIAEMKSEVPVGTIFTVESLLTAIQSKLAAIGGGTLNGLNDSGLRELEREVKRRIVTLVSVHESLSTSDRKSMAHAKLAQWVQRARRRFPLEIFTTNYDFLFELALEGAVVPFFDGFGGSYEPFYCPEAVEDLFAYSRQVKLWKLHGSLGWSRGADGRSVVRVKPADDSDVLIYPSHLKYQSSKKQPYVGLIDRLCDFLQQDDAVLVTCGYSFGDEHINERITTSLRRGGSSSVIALLFDEVWDGTDVAYQLESATNPLRQLAEHEAAGKLSAWGMRHAVIGGQFGVWRMRDEPDRQSSVQIDTYFDEDGAIPPEAKAVGQGTEEWTGEGRLVLPDFRRFASFLGDMSTAGDELASESR